MGPRTFTPAIADEKLEQLKRRLNDTSWPEVIGADDWCYGVPSEWLKDMANYWANDWDWAKVAHAMNSYTHYQVIIDGVPIHYLYEPADHPDAPALILTHGWPWTFWDFKEMIEPLAHPERFGGDAADAFNVVVPSLPGFGFSTPMTTAGINVPRVAKIWVTLMTEVLGFDKFCAHGGDWGALVTAQLSHAHAEKLIGAHLALTLIPGVDRSQLGSDAYADDEQWMFERNLESANDITSHVTVHRLDPQTLGYALTDSPIGTAAWIWERRRNWSDCDGDVESVFDREHLCTTAALYWCTGAINSSMRLYHEQFKAEWPLSHQRTPLLEAPTGFAVFPKDVVHMPRSVLEANCNLQRYRIMPRGGHFGAAEAPELLTQELNNFFGPLISSERVA